MTSSQIRAKALTLPCGTCAAMPGQYCKRTKGQSLHLPRRLEAAKALGMNVGAGK